MRSKLSSAGNAADVLFGKTRQVVLRFLFDQPDRRFYLRELARLGDLSPGALQHELTRLGRADLVVRGRDGNRVSWQANRAHPVFPDLQALVRKTCGIPALLERALRPLQRAIRLAVVYGSVARGEAHARSDVDLLLVGSLTLDEAVAAIAPVETCIAREVGIRLFSPEEFRQRREGGDPFLAAVLAGPLTCLLGKVADA